jgi:hypothetical protein
LVIDHWNDGSGTYTGDIQLAAGRHAVRMEMYDRTGGAIARLWWQHHQESPQWKGEYFANRTLSGAPARVRYDWMINFDWGTNAPVAGLPRDNWSVRWTRAFYFPVNAYRFTVEVDDGARLWIDGELVIDEWHDGRGTYSHDLKLSEGGHQLRMELYERTGNAKAHLRWSPATNQAEWTGRYFANRDLKGNPALVRSDESIDFNWGIGAPAGLPADGFSVQWTANVQFEEGLYQFCARSDDGVHVEMDGVQPFILSEWHDGYDTYCNAIQVPAGRRQVTVEYFENLGGAIIQLWWRVLDLPVGPK